ncbi:MAG: ribbon-helix-helix protein, CopG family [Nitrospirae bacterium]|nr:ribbon-helix-helix protein, CopG family [Nitrospirota bacterium]
MTVATNIRLPEEVLKTLKYKAIEEKKSVNQLIREAIEKSLSISPRTGEKGEDSFDAVIGSAKSGIKDASMRHDKYLYKKK